MFGALATLAQGAVTLALGRAIVGRERTKRAAIFFWPLFLLQPFTLQSSANPDIDTTIYGPLLGLVLLASVRLGRRDGRQRDDQPAKWEYLLPGLFLIAALWAKATTAIVLVAALVLFLPGSWSRRGRALFAAASGAAAMAIFATAFAIWSQLSGLDLRTSLSMLWATLLGGATGATPIEGGLLRAAVARGSEMLAFTVRWIGLLPLLVAGAVVLRPRLSGDGSADARSSRLVARLAGLALLIHLGYCAISGSFGAAPFKYVAPVWAWLVLVLSLVLSKAAAVAFADLSPRDFRRAVMLSLSVAGGAFLLGRFALRDAVLLHAATEGGTLHPQAWALWLPALGCLPWILVSGRGGRAARAAGALAVVSATLFAGSAAGILRTGRTRGGSILPQASHLARGGRRVEERPRPAQRASILGQLRRHRGRRTGRGGADHRDVERHCALRGLHRQPRPGRHRPQSGDRRLGADSRRPGGAARELPDLRVAGVSRRRDESRPLSPRAVLSAQRKENQKHDRRGGERQPDLPPRPRCVAGGLAGGSVHGVGVALSGVFVGREPDRQETRLARQSRPRRFDLEVAHQLARNLGLAGSAQRRFHSPASLPPGGLERHCVLFGGEAREIRRFVRNQLTSRERLEPTRQSAIESA
jgi:hypothetical protein